MTYKKITLIALIALLPFFSNAQSSKLIGKPAPEIVFKEVLNDTKLSYKLSDFKGKYIIIDYWAVWCGPCVNSLPHLAEWQKKYPNDLKVITISTDSKSRLQKFIKNKPLDLPVVLDSLGEYGKYFPHRVIPHTIIIDRQGIVKSITAGDNLKEKDIELLIQGKNPNLALKEEDLNFDYKNDLSTYTKGLGNQFLWSPYIDGIPSLSTKFKNGRILFTNLASSTIYECLTGINSNTRAEWETSKSKYASSNKENLMCLELKAPDLTENEAKELLLKYLQVHSLLSARVEMKDKKVKVLKLVDRQLKVEKFSGLEDGTYSSSGRGVRVEGLTFKPLTEYLEAMSGMIVLDETGVTDRLRYNMTWYLEKPEAYVEELEKLGLKLEDATRQIEVLVFSDKK